MFKAYCVACHGESGKGDGPVAHELKNRPANLTILARRNKGVFPAAAIEDVLINGTRWQAHGSKEMPTWGPVFQAVDQNDKIAYAHIHNLITYLESLQVK